MDETLSAQDIADLLPQDRYRSGSGKSTLLLVAEVLRTFTDDEHGLTAAQIADVVELHTGKRPSECKVLDDVHVIAAEAPFGMVVDIPSRGKAGGIRCLCSTLSPSQARTLINAVKTSKYATRQQQADLCEALYGLVPFAQQDRIAADVHVDRRETSSSDTFAAADVVSEALRRRRKVEFDYVSRSLDQDERMLGGWRARRLVETPIALVYSFGYYYMEAWGTSRRGAGLVTRRLDRMRRVEVSHKEAEDNEHIREFSSTVDERVSLTFDMLGEGGVRTVFLKVSRNAAKYVCDRFGSNLQFEHIDPDGRFGYACVRVIPGATFYRWLFGMSDGVWLAEPHDALWEERFWPTNPKARKPHCKLIRDYQTVLKGFNDQMRQAARAYGWQVS